MYARNFEYDGRFLSDFNCIVCDFDGSSGAAYRSAGSSITFNKVSRNRGKDNFISGVQYDECITATFDICKNPDVIHDGDIYMSSDECRKLIRWLNRSQFCKFRILQSEGISKNFYFNASFNIVKIRVGELVCGLRLTMETDSPWAYGSENKYNFTVTNSTLTKEYRVTDMSDDVGDRYVSMEITCSSAGNLTIENETLGIETYIRGCSAGEKITIDGDNLMIQTSLSRNIWDSFNYEFPKISNSLDGKVNIFKFSLPCSVVIKYKPIIKEMF